MTISPPQPTNGLPEYSTLAAFRAYLESERSALTSALVRDLTEHAPHYRTMTDEQRAERVGENIDDYLAGLDDPTRLVQATERRLGPLQKQGLDLDAALRFTSIYRQHFIDVMSHPEFNNRCKRKPPAVACGC